jgi:hypothetical protein
MTGTEPYLVGATLAVAVSGMSTVVGFDRDRSLYPTVLIIIASTMARVVRVRAA